MLNWCGAVLLHQSNPQQPQYTLVHACTMVVPGVWHRIMQAFDVGGCSGMTQMRSSHYVCARAWACTQASRKHLNKWQFAKLFSRFRDWGTLRIGPADMTSFDPKQCGVHIDGKDGYLSVHFDERGLLCLRCHKSSRSATTIQRMRPEVTAHPGLCMLVC